MCCPAANPFEQQIVKAQAAVAAACARVAAIEAANNNRPEDASVLYAIAFKLDELTY